MGNYRSEYEKYYKNINNPDKNKENKYVSNKINNYEKRDNRTSNNVILYKYFTAEYWSKRLIFELSGALILLLSFGGLKYINISKSNEAYLWCKQLIFCEFNYDNTIDSIASINIGNVKAGDLKIGNYNIYDLKYENIQNQVLNTEKYINNQFISFKNYIEQTTGKKE